MLPLQYPYTTSAEYYTQLLPPAFDPTDLPLYFVYSLDLPTTPTASYLGLIRATTPFFRSSFGDKRLFFKHTITEEDVQFRPELGRLCPGGVGCGPCPQTRDCMGKHWEERVEREGPYGLYYRDEGLRRGYASIAPATSRAFGTPAHPGLSGMEG